jgi:hypothetical protein
VISAGSMTTATSGATTTGGSSASCECSFEESLVKLLDDERYDDMRSIQIQQPEGLMFVYNT